MPKICSDIASASVEVPPLKFYESHEEEGGGAVYCQGESAKKKQRRRPTGMERKRENDAGDAGKEVNIFITFWAFF